jgi:hypothetical protein
LGFRLKSLLLSGAKFNWAFHPWNTRISKCSGFKIGTTLPLDGLEQSWAHLSSWLGVGDRR